MAERLPPAAWREREDLAALIAALGSGQARYVGGAVRDTLLGGPVSDIDIATPLPPDAVSARLAAAGIRAVPTGIEHGTITAALPGGPVEITTLRRDLSTDGRRAVVAFGSDWRADAERRDFTINALYAEPASGELFDYFGGAEDLVAGCVRFIGDARARILEDHLRILRYFRFKARFGSQTTDEAAELACAELAPMLKGLSRERIGMEMMKLLALPDPAPTVARMAELGVLRVILPEGDPAALARLTAEEARQVAPIDPVRRLAALLPPDPPLSEQVAARLRLSGAEKKRLALAAGRADPLRQREGDPPQALAYRLGMKGAIDRLLLTGESIAPLVGWELPVFPLKGGEIVAHGVVAGPEVARILRRVEDRWIAEGFPGRGRVEVLLTEEVGR